MWDLFLDWHEFLPHTLFEVLTAVPPIIFGWVLGHRRHDAKRHPWKAAPTVALVTLRDYANAIQRIERLEVERDNFQGIITRLNARAGVWDEAGEAGL